MCGSNSTRYDNNRRTRMTSYHPGLVSKQLEDRESGSRMSKAIMTIPKMIDDEADPRSFVTTALFVKGITGARTTFCRPNDRLLTTSSMAVNNLQCSKFELILREGLDCDHTIDRICYGDETKTTEIGNERSERAIREGMYSSR